MAIYTTYRPSEFDGMIGNHDVVRSVKKLMSSDVIPHSWMFTGLSGCGKTTIARIIAKKLGASDTGIREVNAANHRGIDDIRKIIDQSQYMMIGSRVSVIILDECHQLTKEAQNALLKSLEDSPEHCYFILTTTDPQKLLKTIRTRCIEFNFEPVSIEEITDHICDIAEKEKIQLSEDVVIEISRKSGGSVRLALNMLEKVRDCGTDIKAVRELISGIGFDFESEDEFGFSGEIFDALLDSRNRREAWKKISFLLSEDVLKKGIDLHAVKGALSARMSRYILKSSSSKFADAVMILENSKELYTNASVIAVLFKIVEKVYEGESRRSEGSREVPR